jgi:hypothetical protein
LFRLFSGIWFSGPWQPIHSQVKSVWRKFWRNKFRSNAIDSLNLTKFNFPLSPHNWRTERSADSWSARSLHNWLVDIGAAEIDADIFVTVLTETVWSRSFFFAGAYSTFVADGQSTTFHRADVLNKFSTLVFEES